MSSPDGTTHAIIPPMYGVIFLLCVINAFTTGMSDFNVESTTTNEREVYAWKHKVDVHLEAMANWTADTPWSVNWPLDDNLIRWYLKCF